MVGALQDVSVGCSLYTALRPRLTLHSSRSVYHDDQKVVVSVFTNTRRKEMKDCRLENAKLR